MIQQLFHLSLPLSLLKLCTSASQYALSRELLEHRKVKFLKAQHFEGMFQKEKQFASQGFDQSAPIESHLHSLIDPRQSPDPETNLQFKDPLKINYEKFQVVST